MMNPHLPAVPPVQPAIPVYRRQAELPYGSQAGHMVPMQYNGYHHSPHPHPQQYYYPPPPQHQQWSQQYHNYAPSQHRPYPQAPLVVSSYAHSQPSPHFLAQPPSRPTSSTTTHSILSPTSSSHSMNLRMPSARRESSPATTSNPQIITRVSYCPPLPWLSHPDEAGPSRAVRPRRKRRTPISSPLLELPDQVVKQEITTNVSTESLETTGPIASDSETTQPSQPPSEVDSTHPTTPQSALPTSSIPTQSEKTTPRAVVPAIPIAPAVPIVPVVPRHAPRDSTTSVSAAALTSLPQPVRDNPVSEVADKLPGQAQLPAGASEVKTPPPIQKVAHKSWADLVRSNASKQPSVAPLVTSNTTPQGDGDKSKSSSLAAVLNSIQAGQFDSDEHKISFLEPRGLVNTGNMCYMNSVLQILVSCVPFYTFLQRIGMQAAHSFKSETPLLDAMIMFMREFRTIDSAISVEKLRMRLKDNELEQYGEAFTPEFVYDAIRRLPKFASMRRGHQQDAEEFLGFLLEELHEECVRAMRTVNTPQSRSGISSPTTGTFAVQDNFTTDHISLPESQNDGGWLEVGPKQKAAITRSSGTIAMESPITKIFGGKLRSELRVQGLKNSVTLEPYQPLQLDIQSPQVHNIVDALKGLTRSETLHGDFNSARGSNVSAVKQVFIDTLPTVLILHLKRFQYDNTGGTQKIWKKIGYPLELEIPKEVFPSHKRNAIMKQNGLPKYRLIGVVYHHGKNASGGHYTVDVRRQEGREWIRIDDTVIRRLRSEDVAHGGSEEDSKKLATATEEAAKNDTRQDLKPFELPELDGEQSGADDGDWKQVNGAGTSNSNSPGGKKAWSGSATPTSQSKESDKFFKDNKVAYLLFYQRINT